MERVKKERNKEIDIKNLKINNEKTLNSKETVWCSKDLEQIKDIESLKILIEKRYQKRQEALNKLMLIGDEPYLSGKDFFNNFYGYFYIDDDCLCNKIISNQSKIIQVGKIFGEGKTGKTYLLDFSNITSLILKSMKINEIKQYLSVRLLTPTEYVKNMNPANKMNSWKTQKGEKIIVVQGDNFSNQTCLHLILNMILKDNPNYVYQYDAFYCQKNEGIYGYNIMETADKGDLSNFLLSSDNWDLMDIVKQIFNPLSILKRSKYGFHHADLKTKNVFVQTGKNGKIIYKIGDYDKSSITWNSVRFYNATLDYFNAASWIINTKFPLIDDKYYTLQSQTGSLQLWTMHYPFGFFLSYDFYTFMYSLMMHPKIWEASIKNKDFLNLWESMWEKDDFEIIMNHIKTEQTKYNETQDKNKQLESMQSMTNINKFFSSYAFKFKYNFIPFLEKAGIKFADSVKKDILNFKESSSGKICYDRCDKWCTTNAYSKSGVFSSTIYEWDYC